MPGRKNAFNPVFKVFDTECDNSISRWATSTDAKQNNAMECDRQRDSEWVSSVLRPHQHSIGYTGDGFYRSKDPTISIKVLKEDLQKTKKTTKTTKYKYM